VGEFLPFWYLWTPEGKARFAQVRRAVVMHDGMFLQAPMPPVSAEEEVEGFRALWHFGKVHMNEMREAQIAHLHALTLPAHLEASVLKLRDDTSGWKGCFGAAMRVRPSFAASIVERYGLQRWAEGEEARLLKTRPDRMVLERTLPLLCHHAAACPQGRTGLFGDIFSAPRAFSLTLQQYLAHNRQCNKHHPWPGVTMVKVWSSR